MDSITALFQIDIVGFIITAFIIIFAVVAMAEIIGKFSKVIGKPVKWVKSKDDDHELLMKSVGELSELQSSHTSDVKELKDDLAVFAKEIRDSIKETQAQIEQFTQNRIHDREQSFAIQKELTENLKTVTEAGQKREKQIENLTVGTMELLGDKIDQRFSKYVELNGIPEDEVDEFNGLYNAYSLTGGNHKRKEKYEYVINHMKILPVESKLKVAKQ